MNVLAIVRFVSQSYIFPFQICFHNISPKDVLKDTLTLETMIFHFSVMNWTVDEVLESIILNKTCFLVFCPLFWFKMHASNEQEHRKANNVN